ARPLDRVATLGRAVGRVAAVDGLGVLPQPGRDEFAEQALAVEQFLDLGSAALAARRVKVGLDHVVVVELHAVEAELLVLAHLGGEGDLLARRRAERIGAGADVPGAEGEAVGGRFFLGWHSSSPRAVPIRTINVSPGAVRA